MASKKTSKSAPAPKSKSVASAAKKLVKKSAAVAKAAFSKKPVKAAVKTPAKAPAKAPAKSVKPSAVKAPPAKPASKPVAKAPAKAPVKAPAKAAAKTVAKPVPKAAPKPAPKAAGNAAPKVTPKAPAKSAKPVAAAPKPQVATPAPKPAVVSPAPAAKVTKPVKPAAEPLLSSVSSSAGGLPIANQTPPQNPGPAGTPAATGKIAKMMSASKSSSSANASTPAAKPPKTAVRKGADNARTLTEDEIRNAPASDYMNDDQLAFFRERLLQMRSEVLAREIDVKERLHQREVFADPADRASAEEEHWLDLRLRERESLLLRKIEDAFRRIRDKEYGYCEKTGEPIGIARLLARPTATVCVDVKGQDERAESQYRDR
jgi:DnaK suppressor protein